MTDLPRQLDLDLDHPVPEDPEAVAELVLETVLEEVRQGRPAAPAAMTFRGARARLSRLTGEVQPERAVRALVEEDRAEAVALLLPVPAPAELGADFAYGLAVEAAAGTVEKVIAFRDGGYRVLACKRPDDAYAWLDGA